MNASAAVRARTRIGWIKFPECGEILYRKRYSVKLKGKDLSELCEICDTVWK